MNNSGIVDITYAYLSDLSDSTPVLVSWPYRQMLGLSGFVPSDAPETRFSYTNVSYNQFDLINSGSDSVFVNATNNVYYFSPQYTQISPYQVYAFISGNRKGLVRIKEIYPGNQGYVKFDMKLIE